MSIFDRLRRIKEGEDVNSPEAEPTVEIKNGFDVLSEKIGREQVLKASQTLQKYKEAKANLEQRIIDNEQWYKLRHWECLRSKDSQVQPTSAWLFNCIANKHAEAMDNFPEPNILPREENDKEEAEKLKAIVPVVLSQNDFEQTYSDVWSYKLKSGTGVYGVFWDNSKLNGLGDISIKKIDLINLFWESGITDIQKSRNLFHLELVDNDILEQQYPELRNKLGGKDINIAQYVFDDTVDTSNKSVVVDWYYKKLNNAGKQVLHYVKYTGDTVLYASENEKEYADRGFYDHGMYPFFFDPLYSVEGTPCGFGYIDIGKSAQEYIDRGGAAIMENMLANTRPRHFIRNSGSINEEEYADMTKDFVHVEGNLDDNNIRPIQGKPLNDIYVGVINNKIDELKETTGNRDISTGGTTSGVTAASAIAAMQEAGSKLSRDNIKASYRVYRQICLMIVELIRQFYDMPRCFRITGNDGTQEFVNYTNENLQIQEQPNELGIEMGMRMPLFDIEIVAQKQSPYSKMAQNEMALQFYGAGFFNPQMADQSLACLEMMDFDRKESVMNLIAQNGGMYQQIMQMQQQMMQMAQTIDMLTGDNASQMLAAEMGGAGGQPMPSGQPTTGNAPASESSVTENARKRVAESTNPV